jgi:hypothetical protein
MGIDSTNILARECGPNLDTILVASVHNHDIYRHTFNKTPAFMPNVVFDTMGCCAHKLDLVKYLTEGSGLSLVQAKLTCPSPEISAGILQLTLCSHSGPPPEPTEPDWKGQ